MATLSPPQQEKADKKEKAPAAAADATPAAGGVDKYGVTPADTKMYKMDMVVGAEAPDITNATKMYRVEGVYD